MSKLKFKLTDTQNTENSFCLQSDENGTEFIGMDRNKAPLSIEFEKSSERIGKKLHELYGILNKYSQPLTNEDGSEVFWSLKQDDGGITYCEDGTIDLKEDQELVKEAAKELISFLIESGKIQCHLENFQKMLGESKI